MLTLGVCSTLYPQPLNCPNSTQTCITEGSRGIQKFPEPSIANKLIPYCYGVDATYVMCTITDEEYESTLKLKQQNEASSLTWTKDSEGGICVLELLPGSSAGHIPNLLPLPLTASMKIFTSGKVVCIGVRQTTTTRASRLSLPVHLAKHLGG